MTREYSETNNKFMFVYTIAIGLAKLQSYNIMVLLLTVAEGAFLGETYFQTRSLNEVIRLFGNVLLNRNPPALTIFWRDVKKH